MGTKTVCEKCGSVKLMERHEQYAIVCLDCHHVQGEPYQKETAEDVTENLKEKEGITRARCLLEVMAGVIPGQAIPEYTRQYVISEYDMDHPPKYIEICGMAMNYAMSLQNPKMVNWVKLEWIWL